MYVVVVQDNGDEHPMGVTDDFTTAVSAAEALRRGGQQAAVQVIPVFATLPAEQAAIVRERQGKALLDADRRPRFDE